VSDNRYWTRWSAREDQKLRSMCRRARTVQQVAPDTALQRRHTVGITVGGRPRIGGWEMILNVANNVIG